MLSLAASSGLAQPFDISVKDDEITVFDRHTGRNIMTPPIGSIIEPVADGLRPDIQINTMPNGFDLVLSYTNSTSSSKTTSNLRIGDFQLGSSITSRDFRWTGQAQPYSISDPPHNSPHYPGEIYSPVAVLDNDNYSVGVSIQYPILDYRHSVLVATRARKNNMSNSDDGRWLVRFVMAGSAKAHGANPQPAVVPPGQTRQYTVSVRIQNKDDSTPDQEWMQTLAPYADFFNDLYGEVKYQRDPRPVGGWNAGGQWLLKPSNPDGFARQRVDLNGWGAFVDEMLALDGIDRHMIWSPTGAHSNYMHNYPFMFASELDRSPKLRTAFDPAVGLPRVPAAGKQLGLWWGHSGWYNDRWNPTSISGFDPHNTRHVNAAFRELDAASRAGATIIGMDAFGMKGIPLWESYPWLMRLQARYPQMVFVVEPKANDVMHNLAPMYIRGHEDPRKFKSRDDFKTLFTPHYLADMLNPGHETWAALRWDMYPRKVGRKARYTEMLDDIHNTARLGYVPLFFTQIPFDDQMIAAETWNETFTDETPKDRSGADNSSDAPPPPSAPNDSARAASSDAIKRSSEALAPAIKSRPAKAKPMNRLAKLRQIAKRLTRRITNAPEHAKTAKRIQRLRKVRTKIQKMSRARTIRIRSQSTKAAEIRRYSVVGPDRD